CQEQTLEHAIFLDPSRRLTWQGGTFLSPIVRHWRWSAVNFSQRPFRATGGAGRRRGAGCAGKNDSPEKTRRWIAGTLSRSYTEGRCLSPARVGSASTPQGRLSMSNSSRRDFLQSTALAGVGFWLAGGVSLGEKKKEGPNDRLRIACIGVGG